MNLGCKCYLIDLPNYLSSMETILIISDYTNGCIKIWQFIILGSCFVLFLDKPTFNAMWFNFCTKYEIEDFLSFAVRVTLRKVF